MSLQLCCACLALCLAAQPLHAAGKRYALLVGVLAYDHADFSELKFTENDAEQTARLLTQAGYDEVVVLTTTRRGKKDDSLKPTAKNVRARLAALSDKVTKDDLLLVGLSGHGLLWPVVDPGTKKEKDESFFCPCDARPRSKQTLEELSKTMLPMGELFRSLDESGAGVRLLLVDACRNEAKGQRRNVAVDDLPRTKKGTAVLFSCKSGEVAHETAELKHGVFFHHVIEGLKGKAKNDRGEVTWTTLAEYVIDRVSEDVPKVIGKGASQTPQKLENVEGRSPVLLTLKSAPADEAERWYQNGVNALGGVGARQDDARAAKWFRMAAEKGHVASMTNLGALYNRGRGVARDEKEALKWYRKAAEKGSATAAYNLGVALQDSDAKESVKWITKAAEAGLLPAIRHLAGAYSAGRGVARDHAEAAKWYRKAAEKGDVIAAYRLGVAYATGQGVTKDDKEAARWYQTAAEKGDARSMTQLGLAYESGRGVGQDVGKALEWHRKAAAKGESVSMNQLGLAYYRARGVKQDHAAALGWFRKAANEGKGLPGAVFNVAACYESGHGVEKDRAEALRWYRLAVARGVADARQKVEELEQR